RRPDALGLQRGSDYLEARRRAGRIGVQPVVVVVLGVRHLLRRGCPGAAPVEVDPWEVVDPLERAEAELVGRVLAGGGKLVERGEAGVRAVPGLHLVDALTIDQ